MKCIRRSTDDNMSKYKTGKIGQGVMFQRIRRITGYLVGTIDRFNDGKSAEVRDRVKHSMQRKK